MRTRHAAAVLARGSILTKAWAIWHTDQLGPDRIGTRLIEDLPPYLHPATPRGPEHMHVAVEAIIGEGQRSTTS